MPIELTRLDAIEFPNAPSWWRPGLRALADEDPRTAAIELGGLFPTLVEGAFTEAAMPFVVQLIRASECHVRETLVRALAEAAEMAWVAVDRHAYLEKPTDFEGEDAHTFVRNRAAVRAHLPQLLAIWEREPDGATAFFLVALAAVLIEAQAVTPALSALRDRTSDPFVRASLEVAAKARGATFDLAPVDELVRSLERGALPLRGNPEHHEKIVIPWTRRLATEARDTTDPVQLVDLVHTWTEQVIWYRYDYPFAHV